MTEVLLWTLLALVLLPATAYLVTKMARLGWRRADECFDEKNDDPLTTKEK